MSAAPARRAACSVAAATIVLSAAACGGSAGGNPPAPSTRESAAVAFSGCMRSHGVPRFPDPTSGGTIPKVELQQLRASSARFAAAQGACRHLLLNGGAGPDAAQLQQAKAQALSYAQCVRRHGVQGFPDPGSDGRIPDPATAGIDQGSPTFEAANQACGRYRPPYMPSNAAYAAWARSHG
jgi:hypothetical protein